MAESTSSRGWLGYVAALFFISLSVLATKEMRLSTAAAAVGDPLEAVVTSRKFSNGFPLRESFTAFAPLDIGISYLVAAFLPGVAGWDEAFRLQQIYFLISFFPIISIWSVEAGRKRNFKAVTSFTSIWALFYQTVGGAIVIPLYYLAYLRESSRKDYWTPESRTVSTSYAKGLIPALTFGYMLPTILMYMPFELNVTQGFVAFWQVTPLVVNMLLYNPAAAVDEQRNASKRGSQDDVKYLNSLYIICGVLSALVHVGTMFVCFTTTNPQLSFANAILRVPVSDQMSMSQALHYIFQADFWIIFTAAVTGAYITLWDLKRAGKTDLSLIKTAAAMALAVVTIGPGATISGVWYIREGIMTRKEKQ